LQNIDLLGALEIRGYEKLLFTAKVSSLHECTSFEPFCVKIGGGLTSRGEPEKNSESHARLP